MISSLVNGNLPNLPKKRKHKEADITPAVLNWFEKNYPKSVALEIKIKGGRIKEHQKIALRQVQDGIFSYKLPDMGRKNPFDGIVLKNTDAFLIVCDGRKCIASGPKEFEFSISSSLQTSDNQ